MNYNLLHTSRSSLLLLILSHMHSVVWYDVLKILYGNALNQWFLACQKDFLVLRLANRGKIVLSFWYQVNHVGSWGLTLIRTSHVNLDTITSSLHNSPAHNWPSDHKWLSSWVDHITPNTCRKMLGREKVFPFWHLLCGWVFCWLQGWDITVEYRVTLLAYTRLTQIEEPQRTLLKGNKSTNKGAEITCVACNRWSLHCKYRCYSLSLHRFTGTRNNFKMEKTNKFHYSHFWSTDIALHRLTMFLRISEVNGNGPPWVLSRLAGKAS